MCFIHSLYDTKCSSRFGLKPNQTADLPVASCVVTRAPIGEDGKPVIRPYTPTSAADSKGFFELIVKASERDPDLFFSRPRHLPSPAESSPFTASTRFCYRIVPSEPFSARLDRSKTADSEDGGLSSAACPDRCTRREL